MSDFVTILLSTYNGLRYCDQQMESLFYQSYPYVTITVRDDGSTDGTYERMMEYEEERSHFVVLPQGENLGPCRSYLTLLRETDANSAYYAFCDQDDVWLPDKLRDAVELMQASDPQQPIMYFSRLELVDSEMRHLGFSGVYDKFGFENALVENIATGCTIVLNRTARNLLIEQVPACVLMHDFWCYLVVSALGVVVYDVRPNVRYRQHGGNAIGLPVNTLQRLKRQLVRYLNPDKSGIRASHQAEEFHRLYGEKLQPGVLRTLEYFLEAKNRILSRPRYALHMDVWKQSMFATLFLPLRILTGRF